MFQYWGRGFEKKYAVYAHLGIQVKQNCVCAVWVSANAQTMTTEVLLLSGILVILL